MTPDSDVTAAPNAAAPDSAPPEAAAVVHGTADARFAPLRDLLAASLTTGEDLGASLCLIEDGRVVADLWGGWADSARTRPWQAETLTNVWSVSKTASSLALLVLIDRDEVDLDAPVARYWPAFGAAGKTGVRVRDVLQHRTGVSGWEQPVATADILDVDAAADRLAAQVPWWPPGTRCGYQIIDYGHLVHGIVRAVTGRPLGEFFADEIARPLGADFWLGLPASEDHRVSDVVPPGRGGAAIERDTIAFRSFTSPVVRATDALTREWRAAGIGGAGGQGNARSVATINAVIAGRGEVQGVRILRPETVDRVFDGAVAGPDLVLGAPLRWGFGWGLRDEASSPYLPAGRVAYWAGWGGSIVVADADRGVTFAYVMNRMDASVLPGERTIRYVRAAFDAL